MKRLVILSGLLWLTMMVYSSAASAVQYPTQVEAANACRAYELNQEGLYPDRDYRCFYGTNGLVYLLDFYIASTDKTYSQNNTYSWVTTCSEQMQQNESGVWSCGEPAPVCSYDTISGGAINGGFGSGIYDVNGCAYTCGTNYSALDGNTSMYDAQECSGTGQPYTSAEPSDYSEPPETCDIKSQTGCLDMDSQPNGSCPAGTTYGRVNDKDVCVPSGTSTDPLDPGSQGIPDNGGDMQAEGTPDRPGTGGTSTGSGTANGSGTSTTTVNGDGTSTTTGETTTETTGPATFGGHGEPGSWWASMYPDGAEGIASKFSADIGNGPFMAMLDPLKNLPDSGSAPSWTFDMNIGSLASFGAVTLEPPSLVWAFVRFCILFTAVMTVRKLIFGG